MLAQAQSNLERRALTSVQLRQGQAECLALPDAQFDLVLSVDVIHHVQDQRAYVKHAFRTLKPRGRICTVTDSAWIIGHREPLAVYWPETIELELARYPRIDDLQTLYQEAGFVSMRTEQVEHRATLTDTQAYRDKAFSSLHLISEAAFRRGMARLERDLRRGPVAWVSRYVLVWGTKP
jgi:ubiquinone/menaquinone biosynthesis C-methylase UbiE